MTITIPILYGPDDVARVLGSDFVPLDTCGDGDAWSDGAGITVRQELDGWSVQGFGVEVTAPWGAPARMLDDAIGTVQRRTR